MTVAMKPRPAVPAPPPFFPTAVRPQQITDWYRFPAFTGKGQRIALLEFGAGYYESDLTVFLRQVGSPRTAMPVFRGIPAGMSQFASPPVNFPLDTATIASIIDDIVGGTLTGAQIMKKYSHDGNWEQFCRTLEVTMDVQVACSLAPDADVRVYLAPPEGDAALVQALRAALEDEGGPPTVICISWGVSEDQWLGAYDNPADDVVPPGTSSIDAVDTWIRRARNAGVTVLCATGDFGSRDAGPDEIPHDDLARVNFPASSPSALAVGGTSLTIDNGTITGEVAWNNEYLGIRMASGGGVSGYFPRPSWQPSPASTTTDGIWQATSRATFDGRRLPDVSAHADRAHGFGLVLGGRSFAGEGTSMAVPIWGALLACIAEGLAHPLGWINERLYQKDVAAAFRDITEGTNQIDANRPGFTAGPGWDAVTGFGAPDGQKLLAALHAAGPAVALHAAAPAPAPPPEAGAC